MVKKSAEIVIVGGGVSGLATSYFLAKMGMKDIVLLEKGFIASGSTGRCGAGIRQQWGTEMNCRMAINACEFYENGNEILEYDGDIEFKQGGYLIIATTEKEHEQFKKNVALQKELGIPVHHLTPQEALEIVPFLNTSDVLSATYCKKDGHLNPFKVCDAFAKAARRLGVEIYTYTEVKDIIVENGRIKGVVTDKGTISTHRVLNTAGGYSQVIAKMAEIDLPVYSERHNILVTEPVEPFLGPMVMSFHKNLYIQQVPHGSVIMGKGDPNEPRDFNINSSWHFLDEMAHIACDTLPPLRELRMVRQWAGLYNMTPDAQPVLGSVEEVEGFYMAIGFSGHGFMMGPTTGRVMAEHILGEESELTKLLIGMLNLKRFEKGELILEPSVV
jgi:sarcosine oxidase subunit beta